jgi:hypothetical protein
MSESTPSNAAPHTANPDIASLYLAMIVTIDDDGLWRTAHEVAAMLAFQTIKTV